MNNKFDSVESALIFINEQPNPVQALHSVIKQAMIDSEYDFASELLEQGKQQKEYQIEISRNEPRVAYRTAIALGSEEFCRRLLTKRWEELSAHIDFSDCKGTEANYAIEVSPRI